VFSSLQVCWPQFCMHFSCSPYVLHVSIYGTNLVDCSVRVWWPARLHVLFVWQLFWNKLARCWRHFPMVPGFACDVAFFKHRSSC
jgi:hypothetical protein